MKEIWPEGPRDWSPRFSKAVSHVAALRNLIPADLVVEVDPDGSRTINGSPPKVGRLGVNGTTVNLSELYEYSPGINGKVAFLVFVDKSAKTLVKQLQLVWILSNGRVVVAQEIVSLLEGKIPGFESLAGRWPFRGNPDIEVL